jgi:hypothetical protein
MCHLGTTTAEELERQQFSETTTTTAVVKERYLSRIFLVIIIVSGGLIGYYIISGKHGSIINSYSIGIMIGFILFVIPPCMIINNNTNMKLYVIGKFKMFTPKNKIIK